MKFAFLIALTIIISSCSGGKQEAGLQEKKDLPKIVDTSASLRKYQRDYSKTDSLIAVLKTHEGDISLLLDFKTAPNTVANFEYLAKTNYYDGVIFHRIIQGFMVQTGDPTGTGRGGPGYTIPDEFSTLKHETGTLSMASTGKANSAGSQFFICQSRQAHLDGQYTIFGKVISGLQTVYLVEANDPIIDVQIREVKK